MSDTIFVGDSLQDKIENPTAETNQQPELDLKFERCENGKISPNQLCPDEASLRLIKQELKKKLKKDEISPEYIKLFEKFVDGLLAEDISLFKYKDTKGTLDIGKWIEFSGQKLFVKIYVENNPQSENVKLLNDLQDQYVNLQDQRPKTILDVVIDTKKEEITQSEIPDPDVYTTEVQMNKAKQLLLEIDDKTEKLKVRIQTLLEQFDENYRFNNNKNLGLVISVDLAKLIFNEDGTVTLKPNYGAYANDKKDKHFLDYLKEVSQHNYSRIGQWFPLEIIREVVVQEKTITLPPGNQVVKDLQKKLDTK